MPPQIDKLVYRNRKASNTFFAARITTGCDHSNNLVAKGNSKMAYKLKYHKEQDSNQNQK